MGNKESDELD